MLDPFARAVDTGLMIADGGEKRHAAMRSERLRLADDVGECELPHADGVDHALVPGAVRGDGEARGGRVRQVTGVAVFVA